jgi:hypothetical protein
VSSRVFRLPRMAYAIVLFLALCVTAFAPGPRSGLYRGDEGTSLDSPLWWLIYLLPVAAAAYIARTATIVDDAGITVRALLGRRRLPWADVRGLSVTGRSVYAVTGDGAVRLPCVRIADLAAVSLASDGHLPPLREATPKYAPSRRRR